MSGHRLTPTHTGKNDGIEAEKGIGPAHPRAYGENTVNKKDGQTYYGSSPHIRGTHGALVRNLNRHRLTPAHTGNTPADKA